MQKENKVIKILTDKSGASLIFVLGIMLMLMAIGTSVLTAAGANVGFSLKQREHSQIMILDDSVHKNIMYSLQGGNTTDEDYETDFLSPQLVMAVYKANDPDLTMSPLGLADMQLVIELGNEGILESGNIKVDSITLSFPEQNVVITPPAAAIYTSVYNDADDITGKTLSSPREPKTATVNAAMVVTVEINAKGKITTSRAIYEYTGGMLTDDPEGEFSNEENGDAQEMGFADGGYGEWRLIKHENIDSNN